MQTSDGEEIPAHRSYLYRCSYFRAAFTQDFKEKHDKKISLPEGTKIIRLILKFIYAPPNPYDEDGDEAEDILEDIQELPFAEIIAVYRAADKYMLSYLRDLTMDAARLKLEENNHYRYTLRGFNGSSGTDWMETADAGLVPILDGLKAIYKEEDKIGDTFKTWIKDFLGGVRFLNNAQGIRRAVFQACHGFVVDIVGEWHAEVPRKQTYGAACPDCKKVWQWSALPADKELPCLWCRKEHSWVKFLASYMAVNGLPGDMRWKEKTAAAKTK